MRLFAVLLVVAIAGCANTPYRADYTKPDINQSQYKNDRSQCKDESWNGALVNTGGLYSGDLFLHFVYKNMLSCMKAKGYEPIGIHPDAYKQAL